MTHDVRTPPTEQERARVQMARHSGDLCARCGRALAEGEPVWIERLAVGIRYGGRKGVAYWRAPVGAECASPAFRAATEGVEPERCAGCGRGVYYPARYRARRVVLCSKRCGTRVTQARAREARGS